MEDRGMTLTEDQLNKLSTSRLLSLYKSRRIFPQVEYGDLDYDEYHEYVDLIKAILGSREHVET